jgi:hypothetical protein
MGDNVRVFAPKKIIEIDKVGCKIFCVVADLHSVGRRQWVLTVTANQNDVRRVRENELELSAQIHQHMATAASIIETTEEINVPYSDYWFHRK